MTKNPLTTIPATEQKEVNSKSKSEGKMNAINPTDTTTATTESAILFLCWLITITTTLSKSSNPKRDARLSVQSIQ